MLALPILLAHACKGDKEPDADPTPTTTFADGLTAEEIVEKSAEAAANSTGARYRFTSVTEFEDADRELLVLEGVVEGANVHTTRIEGDGPQEMLVCGDEAYTRESSSEMWEELDPRLLELISGLANPLKGESSALADVDGSQLTRVPPTGSNGGRIHVIDVDYSADADYVDAFQQALVGIQELTPEGTEGREELPDISSDNWEIRGRMVIGADDFLTYSTSLDITGEIEGVALTGEREYQFWDHNVELEVPCPVTTE
jgi:hypothetical protein